jgi:beta-1,4-N-acetylglucosaminyltransferase
MQAIKICLISSHGGHLRELLNAGADVYGQKYFVTYKTKHTVEMLEDLPHYFILDPYKSFWKFILNGCQSLRHIFKERPDVVISTGAGIAIPTILCCKFFLKSKIVFLESAANVVNPSKTGKFLYKHVDLFMIQWPDLQKHYPRAVYCGLTL